MKTVIIQGSARSAGNTRRIVEIFRKTFDSELIDLSLRKINSYDYEHRNDGDDFLPLMKKIVEYDLLIFATPVYWYSMSGLMKNFFDRITDCLKMDKETGRRLRGKNMAVISCGSEPVETEGFFAPFRLTAGYLGMNYLGELHTWVEDSVPDRRVIEKVNDFSRKLRADFI
jgi:multimeric flavodoxin WrbA